MNKQRLNSCLIETKHSMHSTSQPIGIMFFNLLSIPMNYWRIGRILFFSLESEPIRIHIITISAKTWSTGDLLAVILQVLYGFLSNNELFIGSKIVSHSSAVPILLLGLPRIHNYFFPSSDKFTDKWLLWGLLYGINYFILEEEFVDQINRIRDA